MSVYEFRQNNDVSSLITFTVTDKDTQEITPINLTGSTVKVFISKKIGSAVLVEKTITSHTDAVNGKTTLTLTNEETDIETGNYKIELRLIDSTSKVTSKILDLSILPVLDRT